MVISTSQNCNILEDPYWARNKHIIHSSLCYVLLWFGINTLRPRQMAAIFQTTFSNAFSWMKMYQFSLRLHWSLFPRVKLTIFHPWFRQWLGADQATSHYLNQGWKVYWRIYTSLGLNELSDFTPTFQDYITNIGAIICPQSQWSNTEKHGYIDHSAVLVVNYGISNTTVLEIP